MLTPQEITEKGFVKAVFGGYDMTGVDDFLETVSADYTALYKENAILKGKLKVLVEKVEEYRSTEDAMRMALLTAQRMGEEITVEANKMKADILHNADMEVKAKLAETAQRVADEELRLTVAAKETAKFIELSQAIMKKHSDFLTKLETARRAVQSNEDSNPPPNYSIQPQHIPDQPSAPQQQPAPDPHPVPQQQHVPQQPVLQQQAPQQPVVLQQQHATQQHTPQPGVYDNQVDDVAEMIGNAVEQITNANYQMPIPEPASQHAPAPITSLFDDENEPTRQINTVKPDEIISPRPKFDFDDLKFGANFDND